MTWFQRDYNRELQMLLLNDKVALVTGATHPMGMGFAACRKLAAAGAAVVLTDLARNESEQQNLQSRADEIKQQGGSVLAIGMDITDSQQVSECIEQTLSSFGRLDTLFNNAGTPVGVGKFLDMTDQQWDLSYQVNLKGAVNVCQAAIPEMIKCGGGSIINNSSLSGLGAVADMAAYTATKFAVVGLTKALAAEFGEHNIRVNAVCPGAIWTQMGEMEVELMQEESESIEEAKERMLNDVSMARWGASDEVGDAVVYLASDMASYVSGVALPVAGGMAAGL